MIYTLADRKGCFVADLEKLTMEEFHDWIAFYELKNESRK
jgi:hypothetical protein